MELNSIPKISPGCRLHPSEPVLLVPEGTLNLSGPTRDILALVDGHSTVEGIVDELLKQYSGAPKDQMSTDILDLLNRMEQRGVVRS
jgi:pyrroloquinoline quinone biosynthesis protein D